MPGAASSRSAEPGSPSSPAIPRTRSSWAIPRPRASIDQGAVAIIGPFSSLVAFSVRQVTEKNRTPFLLSAAVADNLTEGGLKYTFRMQPNGKAMATLTVSNMFEMAKNANVPIKRVAMMHEEGNFGTTMGNHVEAFAKTIGL